MDSELQKIVSGLSTYCSQHNLQFEIQTKVKNHSKKYKNKSYKFRILFKQKNMHEVKMKKKNLMNSLEGVKNNK